MRCLIVCAFVWTVAECVDAPKEMSLLSNVPTITEFLQKLEEGSKILSSIFPSEHLMVTDVRRHYIIIAGVLGCVVEYLNSDCTPPDYEHEYLPAIDRMLPIIWEDPKSAVEKVEGFLNDVNEVVTVVKKMSEHYCKGKTAKVCDKMIYMVSLESKIYRKPIEVLRLGSELVHLFEKLIQKEVIEDYGEVALLIKGQDTFRPLVFKASEIYNILYGAHCLP